MTISLGMIAKNEVTDFQRIMLSYERYFDEIVVAVDERIEDFEAVAKGHKVRIIPYKWQNDFAHKRNFLASHIKTDYYFRMDMDDAIINPEEIKKTTQQAIEQGTSIVYCFYVYSKDEWGNCNAAHYRETIIRNDPNLYWNKPIHENILPKNTQDYRIFINDTIKIDHRITHEHSIESAQRNIKYLLAEFNRDKEKTDLRTIAYLGRMLFSIGEFDKSLFFLEKHIQGSGWDEDRYVSWCQMADIYKLKKNYSEAIACAFEALQEKPNYPDAYLKLHDIYFDQEIWDKAIEWGEQGLLKPRPKTFTLIDPSSYGWRPSLSLAYCYFKSGDVEKANELFKIVEKQVPTLEFIKQNKQMFELAVEHKRYMEHFLWIVSYLKEKKPSLMKDLLQSVPPALCEHELIVKLKHAFLPPEWWSDKSIVIFCGMTAEEWSPLSVQTGIGGSEEAVINLSNELTKLGHEVTVYNNCGDSEGDHKGVKYLNWYKFNPVDHFNIVVSWRMNVFVAGVQARQRIVWIHDLPYNMVFDKDTMVTFDKIVVLSEYHKSLLPKIAQKKAYISTNGLVRSDFKGVDEAKRDKHRVIYASSYNRGLETILNNWDEVKKQVPEATLHIYYGWKIYDEFVKQGRIRDKGFKPRMIELFKKDGVYEHGRIGHKQLLEEYYKSGVYAYPSTYQGEINCIALSKAIACGCIPVTNKFAVMGERNPIAVDDKDFIPTLIKALKGEVKFEVDEKKYIGENSWGQVAKDWNENLLKINFPTVVQHRLEWIKDNCPKDEKIVDIGCAEGHTFKGWDRDNIVSVDIDDHSYLPNFVKANANNLPFEDKRFDTSVLCEILEHVDDPGRVLKEAQRVSKKVIITVPYEQEWRQVNEPLMKIEDKEKATGKTREQFLKEESKISFEKYHNKDNYEHLWHKRFYTPETFAEELKKAGLIKFKLIKIRNGQWAHLGAVVGGNGAL